MGVCVCACASTAMTRALQRCAWRIWARWESRLSPASADVAGPTFHCADSPCAWKPRNHHYRVKVHLPPLPRPVTLPCFSFCSCPCFRAKPSLDQTEQHNSHITMSHAVSSKEVWHRYQSIGEISTDQVLT